MGDVRPQPRFSIVAHCYFWIFFALLSFLPLLVMRAVGERTPFSNATWVAAFAWPVAIALLFLYANRMCSSDNMTFRNGLLWVTTSMLTGWSYLSFATVFPALLVTFFGGVFVAISGGFRRDVRYAPWQWPLIVKFFYRHRMRQ